MDTKRFLLAIGLTLLVLWLYEAWLEYQYPGYPQSQQVSQQDERGPEAANGQAKSPSVVDGSGGSQQGDVPEVSQAEEPKGQATPAAGGGQETVVQPGIEVANDVLRVAFGARSGDPVRAELLNYRKKDRPDSPAVTILKPSGQRVVVAQSGWLAKGLPAPSHEAEFTTQASGSLALQPGQDQVSVTFTHTADDLVFRKTYRLERGSYQVGAEYSVINRGEETWRGHLYGQLRERGSKPGGNFLLAGFSYDGPVVFTDDAMETFSHGDLLEREGKQFQKASPEGWGGVMSRYFLTAWVPDAELDNTIYARATGPDTFAGYFSPFPAVGPGEQASVSQTLFLGPKDQSQLEGAGRHLRRSVDYGILSFLAIPLFEVLQFFHSLVGNYGLAIILVTLVIKVVFFPLFSMSYRAMAKMRKVQPELQKLREQYGDDRQKLNEEMMRLYREEKVNPLGGCLPILVQIPVFISLYWVLLESVELRHEPFMLWITDLTSQDPFYVLPILMGASMVVQQLLNPSPLDPIQKKVMLALPVVFTVFFIQFPAGLVLYWLSNNLISIGQQWWIMRKIG